MREYNLSSARGKQIYNMGNTCYAKMPRNTLCQTVKSKTACL